MTLIAAHAGTDSATILTDSWSYESNGRTLGRIAKVTPVPVFDAALTSQGDGRFNRAVAMMAAVAYDLADDFDGWLDVLPTELNRLWADLQADLDHYRVVNRNGEPLVPSVAVVVGYSARAGRFTVTGFASDDRFAPFTVDGVHVQPSPVRYRPSRLELARIAKDWGENPTDADAHQLAQWSAKPPAPVPASDEDWLELAGACRSERAMQPVNSGVKVLVGGDIYLTTVARGGIAHRRIGAFDDSNEVVSRIMAGTMHPLGQIGPCPWCDSGQRAIDCHLQNVLDDPCPCASGQPFRVCCSVHAAAPAEQLA